MLKSNWVNTKAVYESMLKANNVAEREEHFTQGILSAWKPMLDMMSQMIPGMDGENLAGARMMNWLLPDQTKMIQTLLDRLSLEGSWNRMEKALIKAADRFSPYADLLPFDTITGWLIFGNPHKTNSFERGYSGATDWVLPQFVCQIWEPNEDNIPKLDGLVAHEMHHLIRRTKYPFDPTYTTVAEYIILEGTAEAFATSLFGEHVLGFYCSEVSEIDLERASGLIRNNLHTAGFDQTRGYVFGDTLAGQFGFQAVGGMPTYGGYAVGYRIVKAFLDKTGTSIEETTFLPAAEIIEGSGYFQ